MATTKDAVPQDIFDLVLKHSISDGIQYLTQ